MRFIATLALFIHSTASFSASDAGPSSHCRWASRTSSVTEILSFLDPAIPQGLVNDETLETISAELVQLAAEDARARGIPSRVSASGQSLVLSPAKGNLISATAEGLAARASTTLAYHPLLLFTNANEAINDLRFFGDQKTVYLTHRDFFSGALESEFFREQMESLVEREFTPRRPVINVDPHGKTWRDYEKFRAKYLDPYTDSARWPAARQRSIAGALQAMAEKHFAKNGIRFRRISPTQLQILPDPRGAPLNVAVAKIQGGRVFYDALALIEKNTNAVYRMRNRLHDFLPSIRRGDILLAPEEAFSGSLYKWATGQIALARGDAKFPDARELLDDYLTRRIPQRIRVSGDEPVFAAVSNRGDAVPWLTPESLKASRTFSILSDDFLSDSEAVDDATQIAAEFSFDRFLKTLASPQPRPDRVGIGRALQTPSGAYYLLDLTRISSPSAELPAMYAHALENYLDFLQPIYAAGIGIGPEKFAKLREISEDARARTDLITSTKTKFGSIDGAERNPFAAFHSFAARDLPPKLDFQAGMLIVRSRSSAEPLPLETLNQIRLQRSPGESIAEISRMGALRRQERTLEFVKIAAVHLKFNHPDVSRIVIEVDAVRGKAFRKYGFTPAEVSIDSGYYRSGADQVMVADIDTFLEVALADAQ